MKPRRFPFFSVMAANETDALVAANEGVATAEYIVQEGGNMIVPYSRVPITVTMGGRKVTVLQLIDAQAANDLAADMSGMMGKIKGLFVGRPIFAGHPYHPDPVEAAKWPDKRSRGNVSGVEVGNESMTLLCKYNGLGTAEVEDAQFIGHSPQWRLRPVMGANGQQLVENGMPVFRPYSLHSAGLTNNPNIPVPPLVAANEDAAINATLDLNKIIAALTEAGLIKGGEDEASILNAIGGAARELQWARERKQREERELELLRATASATATAANEMDHEALMSFMVNGYEQALKEQATMQEKITAANEAWINERKARATLALEPFIRQGKITGAERDAKLALLVEAANETAFEEALQSICKETAKLKTEATHSAALKGARRVVMAANEQGERSRERSELVHACLAEITQGRPAQAGDSEKAWNMARARKPALFTH